MPVGLVLVNLGLAVALESEVLDAELGHGPLEREAVEVLAEFLLLELGLVHNRGRCGALALFVGVELVERGPDVLLEGLDDDLEAGAVVRVARTVHALGAELAQPLVEELRPVGELRVVGVAEAEQSVAQLAEKGAIGGGVHATQLVVGAHGRLGHLAVARCRAHEH